MVWVEDIVELGQSWFVGDMIYLKEKTGPSISAKSLNRSSCVKC